MPYLEEIVSIGRADNGYVINVYAPVKKGHEGSCCCAPSLESGKKTIVCSDVNDLAAKLQKLLPALDDKATTDEAFEDAFEEACGTDMSEGDD